MADQDFKVDSARDATDSIRGYVYQAYQSVLAWMRLKEDEILVLEGAEDFDVRLGNHVEATQVKDLSGNITLRSPSVVEAINNFWGHGQNNPDYEVSLRFLSTADAGIERGRPFGDASGIGYWRDAAAGRAKLKPLRDFLLGLGLTKELAQFVGEASDEALRSKLIQRIDWDLGAAPTDALRAAIEDKLKFHGSKQRINTHHSRGVLPHLLKHVADLLSTKGAKQLTYVSFLDCFDAATMEMVPRSEMELLRGGGGALQQLMGALEGISLAQLTMGPRVLGLGLPLVEGVIQRSGVVEMAHRVANEHRIVFLHGSSGVGKTNLAALVAHNIGGNWAWAGFRGFPREHIREILSRAAFEMNALQLSPLLVLDDLDVNLCSSFERELMSLIFSVKNAGGVVLITSLAPPPAQLLPKLWLDERSEFQVPYFDEAEVAEMVRNHGLNEDQLIAVWARTIWLTTSGHPQLVHARVRNLAARGWPVPSMDDIVRPDDVERVRREARQRLVNEFPSEGARNLAYRLSLVIGAFSRETALAIGSAPPPVPLPGEVFDSLVGPWIERIGQNKFKISPLLSGAANSVLPNDEVLKVHEIIASTIINRRGLDQHEIGMALSHAIIAKFEFAIMHLSMAIVMVERTNMGHLSEAMTWLPAVAREPGAHILPDNPSVELLFRLAQYKIATSMQRESDCLELIENMKLLINAIPHRELRLNSEWLTYSAVLNTIDVHIPSATVVNMLSRVIDLADEIDESGEMFASFEAAAAELPRIGENKPAQILMSYQAVRIRGLDDLIEMVDCLEALPEPKREFLLKVCDSDNDFASLLISRAWWKDSSGESFNIEGALQKLAYCDEKFTSWNRGELSSACLVAMSVISDEYGHDTERSLSIIYGALLRFPNDVGIINQKAKILFHAKRYRECLEVCDSIRDREDLPAVERAFMFRSSGISAAAEGDWTRAADDFRLGAQNAQKSGVQKPMFAGLLADAAMANWSAGDFATSLRLLAESLTALAEIPFNEELQNRHVHATVRHCVAWTHFQARGEPTDLFCPPPGTCSNQSPHEGMKDFPVKDLGTTWQLLSGTERALNLSIGIAERALPQVEKGGALIISLNNRSVAFEQFCQNGCVDDLIPALQGLFESIECTKAVQRGEVDGWSPESIPPLPDDYWAYQEGNVAHFLLVGALKAAVTAPQASLPITRWSSDLAQRGGLTGRISKLLNVFDGEPPGEELYEQAAFQLMQIWKEEAPAPYDLWIACFRLLNAVATEATFAGPPLDVLVLTKWRFAVTNQRFAFAAPSLTCPAIEQLCANPSIKGLSRVAAILEAAAPGLRIPLAKESWDMLRIIREKGRYEAPSK